VVTGSTYVTSKDLHRSLNDKHCRIIAGKLQEWETELVNYRDSSGTGNST